MSEGFNENRASCRLDNSKKSIKNDKEIPVLVVGKLKRVDNLKAEFDDKKVYFNLVLFYEVCFHLELPSDQHAALKLLIDQTFVSAYKDVKADYFPYNGNEIVIKCSVICLYISSQ